MVLSAQTAREIFMKIGNKIFVQEEDLFHRATVYPLLYAPTNERRRAQRGLNSKNIFHLFLFINLFFVLDFGQRGIKGVDAQNLKLLIVYLKLYLVLAICY